MTQIMILTLHNMGNGSKEALCHKMLQMTLPMGEKLLETPEDINI